MSIQKTILIAGGTGLVGQRLSEILKDKNYRVKHLSRNKKSGYPYPLFLWDLNKGFLEENALNEVDIIINLAGANVSEGRWTDKRKKMIIDSRVKSTNWLYQYLKNNPGKHHVQTFINASAVGWYGNRGDEVLTEQSTAPAPAYEDFMSETCSLWEEAVKDIPDLGIRTLILRIGLVLSTKGGVLEKTMLPMRFGAGAYFGNGQQFFPWIHIDDVCGMIIKTIEEKTMEGIYNIVGPQPVNNKVFTQTLARVVSNPVLVFPVPMPFLKIALGEMSSILNYSSNVLPERMLKAGYKFLYPELKEALRHLLEEGV